MTGWARPVGGSVAARLAAWQRLARAWINFTRWAFFFFFLSFSYFFFFFSLVELNQRRQGFMAIVAFGRQWTLLTG